MQGGIVIRIGLRGEDNMLKDYSGFGRAVIDWIIAYEMWGDERGDDICEIAKKYGLAKKVKYDPKKHGEIYCADEGDKIWWLGK